MPERLWIDAGGTRVRAFAQDGARMRMLFETPSGPGAIEAAVRRARARRPRAVEILVGARGAWTPAEKASWKRRLKGGRARVTVLSDVELAHKVAFGEGAGILLNAGTGSIAFGRDDRGRSARAGGLGPLLGDDGSAFWIGREYVRRVESKRASLASLRALAVGANPVAAIAAKSKAALRAAASGGEAARIVSEAQDALVDLVVQVAKDLKAKKPLPVALGGGLFSDERFLNGFRRRLSARGAPVEIRRR